LPQPTPQHTPAPKQQFDPFSLFKIQSLTNLPSVLVKEDEIAISLITSEFQEYLRRLLTDPNVKEIWIGIPWSVKHQAEKFMDNLYEIADVTARDIKIVLYHGYDRLNEGSDRDKDKTMYLSYHLNCPFRSGLFDTKYFLQTISASFNEYTCHEKWVMSFDSDGSPLAFLISSYPYCSSVDMTRKEH
jgi:hypothetical protein